MALFFSNTISVSAQLCFKKGLACLGVNHVIKGERRQKTQPRPQDFALKKWEKPWGRGCRKLENHAGSLYISGKLPTHPSLTPACYLFSIDFACLRIV